MKQCVCPCLSYYMYALLACDDHPGDTFCWKCEEVGGMLGIDTEMHDPEVTVGARLGAGCAVATTWCAFSNAL